MKGESDELSLVDNVRRSACRHRAGLAERQSVGVRLQPGRRADSGHRSRPRGEQLVHHPGRAADRPTGGAVPPPEVPIQPGARSGCPEQRPLRRHGGKVTEILVATVVALIFITLIVWWADKVTPDPVED